MEKTVQTKPLLFESAMGAAAAQIRRYKLPLSATFVFAFLAYMFAFTNKLINHDEAGQLFDKGATTTSGRWGIELLRYIFPDFSMPWIYGIVTICLMAVAICLILHMFHIRRAFLQVLLAGGIIVFPSLIGVFSYMFTSSSYAVSFLLAVTAVWLIRRPGMWNLFFALGCMILSLGIYQSYLSIAASLLVLLLIQMLLEGEDFLPVLKKGIYYVVFLLTALAFYYVGTQIILKLCGTTFNSYASDSITFSISGMARNVLVAYVKFSKVFEHKNHWLIPNDFSHLVYILLLAAIAVLLLVWFLRQKEKKALPLALLAVLIFLLPLAINCMYLITAPDSIHALVLYSFIAVYILAVVLCDHLLPQDDGCRFTQQMCRFSCNAVAIALSAIIIVNTYIANAAFLNLHLRYENAYAFYSALIADIKLMPEFTEDAKLAVIGNWDSPDYYHEKIDFAQRITGTAGFYPDSYSKEFFLEFYLGFPMLFASDADIAAIQSSADFAEMPVYPYYGSMKAFDNIIVVKLS